MSDRITIVGGGLVGTLLGVMLAKRGATVRIFERRPDMRSANIGAGRSINLAMSDRGLRALEVAGIADDIRAIAIPMSGRVMHDLAGNQTYQPYGLEGQAINSVSRGELNKTLLTVAERHGVEIVFDARCTDVDLNTASASFALPSGETITADADVLFGADGAYSAVRGRMQFTDRFDYSQTYLKHGYKELHIPPGEGGAFKLEKHALHIWPRHSFMMIALPNLDGSFTLTLFFAHEGPTTSFEQLRTREAVEAFFNEQFPDAVPLMPTLIDDFFTNPESSLMMVRCEPWVMNDRIALIGDAAHAIVPFYGQGMNCGFEDCRILMECLDHANNDWASALQTYQTLRKPAGDAILDLALDNFIEMRDKVADPRFLWRKKIEAWLFAEYPGKFIPLYTMVTFSSDIPYNEAKRIGAEQDVLMESLMNIPSVIEDWTSDAAKAAIRAVMDARPDITIASGSPS
ncbi:MAG: FAD-dependent monooxygenase [Candidatus Kapabacteria bacterium]|nr:FAD-dependent monooxygenase [Ignavibacteria bacterium]MBP6509536.1 FAD-dependent monooxygenase [Candidatus Kapabacteria bacterium]MBK7033112.1 FAD-dependent monooxygenase [Ignavibacteria bacterium]MBK7413392.1 FAD-dependent monooxygenase [Ignavibacteria bacterium]MBL0321725.1 FAD-dependent monooxygenase [Ignavibacteria bacterium]